MEDIKYVMFCWQNFAGLRCGKLKFKEQYEIPDQDQVGKVALMSLFCPAYLDIVVKGLSFQQVYGDLRCIPDKSTFRKAPWSKNQGLVFCKFYNSDNTPFKGCPRHLLENALGELKKLGYEIKAGFELEFAVFKKDTLVPYDNSTYYSLHSLAEAADKIESLIQQLNDQGIKIETFHKEGAKGQFEIALKYDDLMKSIDNYFITKEVVACFFNKIGYTACFLPKVLPDCGNGAHAHISIWKDGKNAMGDANGKFGLSSDGAHFIAGILNHYNALVHFMAPSANSLRRIKPNAFVGAYKYWGRENREAPIKLVTPIRPGDLITNFEIKTFDNTCNQYFAFAAIIICGIEGIKQKTPLPEPYDTNIADLTEEERKGLGIVPLPLTFEDRKKAILSEEGDVIRKYFGDSLIYDILRTHEADVNYFANKTFEEEVKYLFEKY